MKFSIEKLLEEYEFKITNCDKLIYIAQVRLKEARKSNDDVMRGLLSKEIAVKNAQRQAYIQAKSDIDSLLDYIDN